ncbi:lipopolysaccharide biosynthesis protein [Acinetobacter towneri]|uniref:lipopolysaccharide biosynthesis protein n=1 Tax=Acinetobacter towneri TaxID=202956 RepID=UPI003A8A888E
MNVRKIAGFAVGPIGGAFLGFITLPLTAWFFSTEDIGRIALLQIVLGFTTMLFSLGLDQAYVREYHEKENKSELWKQTTFPGLYLVLLVSFILIIHPYLLSELLFDTQSWLISFLVIVLFIANYLIRFFSLILRMQEKGFLFSMSQIWPKFFNIILLLNFFLIYNNSDFIYLLYAQVFSSIIACLIFAWNTRQEWIQIENLKLNFNELKPLLQFGMPLVIGGMAFWGLNSIDRLFLKVFSDFDQLGIYSIATSFATIAIIVQSIFSTVWAPTVYKWIKNNENLDKIHDITSYLTIIIIFIFSLVGLCSNLITLVLPEQYNLVQYIVLPALVAPLLYTLSETTVVGISISRKSHLSLYASCGAFCSALLFNYILTPKLGALGASISSSLSFLTFFVLRTEFSVIAWKSFPRKKVYLIVFLIVGLAITNALFQEEYNWIFKLIWLIFLLISSMKIWKILDLLRKGFVAQTHH